MGYADVIVLGAGISGSIAAGLLSQLGYKVIILSRDNGTAYHLPESWCYNSFESLTKLGIKKDIQASFTKQSHFAFCSPSHEQVFEMHLKNYREHIEQKDLVWVDRNRFDQILLAAALKQGAHFLPFHNAVNCHCSDDLVTVYAQTPDGEKTFNASYVLDATGKMSFLSQKWGLPCEERKLDARVAYFSHFECERPHHEILKIFSLEGGYLFCIPVSETRLSIGCVIAEHVVEKGKTPEEIFYSRLQTSSYLSKIVTCSTRKLPIIPAKNVQRICLQPASVRYRLIGDAATFLDPFFTSGIDFAFFSAEKVVESLQTNDPHHYTTSISEWIKSSLLTVYDSLETGSWQSVIRLFADPHLPYPAALMLSKGLCQLQGRSVSIQEGMACARKAYEVAAH